MFCHTQTHAKRIGKESGAGLSAAFRGLDPEGMRFYEELAQVANLERVHGAETFQSRKRKHRAAGSGNFHLFHGVERKIAQLKQALKEEASARICAEKQRAQALSLARKAAAPDELPGGVSTCAGAADLKGPPHMNWSPGPCNVLEWLPAAPTMAKARLSHCKLSRVQLRLGLRLKFPR